MQSKPLWTKEDIYEMIRVAETYLDPSCKSTITELKNRLKRCKDLRQFIRPRPPLFEIWYPAYWWGLNVLRLSSREASRYEKELIRTIQEYS